MIFNINYPEGLVEPQDLHLPKLEDIEKAAKLAAMVADYVDDFEEYDEITIRISDQVSMVDGKLVSSCNGGFGEEIVLFPASSWGMEEIFDTILCNLFEG